MSTAQRILDAALICFTEHGVEATSIARIREQAGVSIGSLYHHFASKEVLAAALYLHGVQSFQAAHLGALSSDSASSGIQNAVREHLNWVESNRELSAYLLHHPRPGAAADGPSELELVHRDLTQSNRIFLRSNFSWFDARVSEGQIRPIAKELFLPLLLGPAQEFTRHWLAGRMTLSPRQAAPELACSAWKLFAPTGEAHEPLD